VDSGNIPANPMNRFAARILPILLIVCLVTSCATVHRGTTERLPGASRWTNSLGMVFVPVPGTKVSFSIWETRVKDFAAFAATGPKLDGTNWNHALYHDVTPVSDGPDYPVVGVSWNDAIAFCVWLTETERKAGNISTNAAYRLPTDAEWSWAVGIGDRETNGTPKDKSGKLEGAFPWGTQYPPPAGAGNFADLAAREYFTNWPCIEGYRDGFVTSSPVGSFPPNKSGLYDLAGNALEWCDDFYDAAHKQRTMRGGGWNNTGPKSLLSSTREHVAPQRFSVVTGFRCVLEIPPAVSAETAVRVQIVKDIKTDYSK
jgi:formylglycine-generating enzyme required for sulfatase activity